MDILEIRRIAGQLGINAAGRDKVDLVRAIQRAEGLADCFGCAESEECDEEGCMWREECLFESVAAAEAV